MFTAAAIEIRDGHQAVMTGADEHGARRPCSNANDDDQTQYRDDERCGGVLVPRPADHDGVRE